MSTRKRLPNGLRAAIAEDNAADFERIIKKSKKWDHTDPEVLAELLNHCLWQAPTNCIRTLIDLGLNPDDEFDARHGDNYTPMTKFIGMAHRFTPLSVEEGSEDHRQILERQNRFATLIDDLVRRGADFSRPCYRRMTTDLNKAACDFRLLQSVYVEGKASLDAGAVQIAAGRSFASLKMLEGCRLPMTGDPGKISPFLVAASSSYLRSDECLRLLAKYHGVDDFHRQHIRDGAIERKNTAFGVAFSNGSKRNLDLLLNELGAKAIGTPERFYRHDEWDKAIEIGHAINRTAELVGHVGQCQEGTRDAGFTPGNARILKKNQPKLMKLYDSNTFPRVAILPLAVCMKSMNKKLLAAHYTEALCAGLADEFLAMADKMGVAIPKSALKASRLMKLEQSMERNFGLAGW